MCVKVCASVSARVWVRCAFNSFGMIMRKIKHTPHRPCTRIWSVETRQAFASRFSFRLSAISDRQMERTREQEALSMLFMCHALLTHLICLKRTTLKHSPSHTHTLIGVYHTLTWDSVLLRCDNVSWMSYEYNNTIIKKRREKAIFMHRQINENQ